jgi:hypothetical protein
LKFDYTTSDLYRLDKDATGKVLEMWLPRMQEGTPKIDPSNKKLTRNLNLVYDVWTPDTYTVYDSDLEIISQEVNKYGVIPWVYLEMDDDPTVDGGGLWELCFGQLLLNKLLYLIDENASFSALQIWVTSNLSEDAQRGLKTISPRMLVHLGQSGIDEPEPTIYPVAGESLINEFFTYYQEFAKTLLKNRGLPQSIVSDGGGLASGIAILADRMELEDIRGEDITILKPFENDLINMALLVLHIDQGQKQYNELKISIDYKEFRAFIEPQAEYEYSKQLVNDGLITMKTHIQNTTGEEFDNEEDLKQYMINNKQFLKEVGYGTSGSEEQTNINSETQQRAETTGGNVQIAGETN